MGWGAAAVLAVLIAALAGLLGALGAFAARGEVTAAGRAAVRPAVSAAEDGREGVRWGEAARVGARCRAPPGRAL